MIQWISPIKLWPPHAVTHPEKVAELIKLFKARGWGVGYDALVAYPTLDNQTGRMGIQLLSGSHRWAAAVEAGIHVPVVVLAEETVERCWGNVEMWKTMMGMGSSHAKRFDV